MMEKLKKHLLYAGFDRSQLEMVATPMSKVNRAMAGALSTVAALLIGIMFILSFFIESVAQNRMVYFGGMVFSIIVLFLSRAAKKHRWLVWPVVYASYSIYYLYGIFIGAITDPGNRTVTFIVMLVFMPTLFVGTPIQVLTTTAIYDTIFVLLSFMNKTEPVLSVDLIDAAFYGVLGVVGGSIINRTKIRSYLSEQQLQEISRIDQLTQTNNRNAYELDLFSISSKCAHSLACLYIDVNGLHELNNSKGHEYGDEMLKYVALQIKNQFSEKYTYRIGGDEFVVFIPDMSRADVGVKTDLLSQKVEEGGYHIATGYDQMNTRQLSIERLIRNAENAMFKNKTQFYKDIASRGVRNNETNN